MTGSLGCVDCPATWDDTAKGEIPRSGVIEPGAGQISTRGPVHLDRRATTSARRSRSAKVTLGCDLICLHAASHGIVSPSDGPGSIGAGELDVALPGGDTEGERFSCTLLQAPVFPQQPFPAAPLHTAAPSERQMVQGEACSATDLFTAAQKAFPNASSAQAGQFDGSPVQEGGSEGGVNTGNTGVAADVAGPRRRRGTGGWYGGRLSRMDGCVSGESDEVSSCSAVA